MFRPALMKRGTVEFGQPHCPNGHLLGWIGERTSCDGAGCEYNRREA